MKYKFSWLTHKAHKEKNLHGFGVFAGDDIKKGERIICFGGYVINKQEFDTLPVEMKIFPFQIDDDLFLGLSNLSELEEADYLNHSCDPNSGFNGEIFVVAMRDIKIGEEITIDYAMCSSDSRSLSDDMENCLCGAKSCRGKVTIEDWRMKTLQDRYEGFFQPYLLRKIKNTV